MAMAMAIYLFFYSKKHYLYDVINRWANNAQLESRKQDCLGCVPNVGIATFQKLRIVFGVDTVKPDQRVIEILHREFGIRLTPKRAIHAVDKIARITQLKTIAVDQIFFKYEYWYYMEL